ncbi:putative membrane protein [Candidatus Rhodobacter oscarellae]|uniref:Putative membrane protein n=1 Tax=Candidatus Rhodobacter oscarellae TaxID=1675527 RepID=A0A0J9E479_9RHOB|nr:MFS transporter [Candidatus Rhodobacter lobularis]KMW57522.1 putative membrane protein [Candidatus Rhodobacter lobularis]
MTDATLPQADDRRARRNVVVLVILSAVMSAQMPMLFIIAGLAGQSLSSNICFATLPISMIVLGSMLSATPMSAIMQRYGRRAGFFLGGVAGASGGLIGAYALSESSFGLLLLGSLITGTYMSAQGFFRFAAADTASESFRPKAISYVMAGGLIAAVLGPQLAKVTENTFAVPFLGTYLAVIGVNILGALVIPFLDIPRPPRAEAGAPRGRTRWELLTTPKIAVAIICAMVSYALMNLVMTSTPLAVVGCGFVGGEKNDIVMSHVLGMFAPSFFTGHLIARFGAERIVATGLVLLAMAGGTALAGVELLNFFGALILLGLGWNFGFIGATAMLASAHTVEERGRVQGLNDMLVFGCVTVASLASGGLMNCAGADPVAGWTAVNLAMGPFLLLAGAALTWFVMRPKPV